MPICGILIDTVERSILLGKDEGAGPSRILGAKKQSNMKNFVLGSKPKMSKERYEKITMKLPHFCAQDFRPISIVCGDGFKNFISELHPSYEIPSHTTIRNYVK